MFSFKLDFKKKSFSIRSVKLIFIHKVCDSYMLLPIKNVIKTNIFRGKHCLNMIYIEIQ